MQTIQNIKLSCKEFKKTKSLVLVSLFTGLNLILANFKIRLSTHLQIGFSSLAAAVGSMYYGPLMAGVAGLVADNLKFFLLNSGDPYFPGFGINEFLTGFIYGMFFYKKEITWKRVGIARFLVVVIVNLILTSLWLNIMYGKGFLVYLSARIIKNIVAFPFDVIILYNLLQAATRIKRPR